ncbi:glycosyltransferase [Thalassospira alkalitolerans]|uniref:glycosyltransferase n=1 Tax=Thalassospira alkalitolerans TaxID=1293890 RepID=UPI003AA9725F
MKRVVFDEMVLETSEHTRPVLAAVVVTFNRFAQLKTTLTRLLNDSSDTLMHVIVVNNGSLDGTREWLDTIKDPRLDAIHLEDNLGGAGGFALGMRRAFETHHADWVVVMDDDSRPFDGALETFVSVPRDDATAYGAAVYYPDGQICEMNRPSLNPFWHPRVFLNALMKQRDGYHIPYDAYDHNDRRAIDMTSFVGFFVSKRIVQAVGYPDPNLFLYGDDVLYTMGVRRQGFEMRFDPHVKFEHDCSTFSADKHRRFIPLWKVYYLYRNGLMTYRSAAGPLFWLLVPVLTLKWSLAAKRYGAERTRYRRLMWHAISDAIRAKTDRSHKSIVALAQSEDTSSET